MPTLIALITLSLVAAILLTLWMLARAALTAERRQSAQLRQSLAATEADREAWREKTSLADIRSAGLNSTLAEIQRSLQERQTALEAAIAQSAQLRTQLEGATQSTTRLEGELAKHEALAAERQAQAQQFQAKLDEHLQALTRKLYDEHGPKMMGEGRQQLEQALAPFRERLVEFQTRINEVHAGDLRDRASLEASLKKELEGVLKAQSQLSTDADRLTRALTGDSKTQGDWGELTLLRLMEDSGLRQNTDYELQASIVDEDQAKQWRPDVIIHMPNARSLVIDAKVSLTAHAKAMGATDPKERQALMKEHAESVKAHIKTLASRDYPRATAQHLNASVPDFTLLYMPTEASFAAAMGQDPGLWSYGYLKKIVVVSPTTLLATLRIVEQLWRVERNNKNQDELVKIAGELVEKLAKSANDFEQVERMLGSAGDKLQEARKRLSGGKDSAARKAGRMVELGVRASADTKKTLAEGDDAAQLPEPT